MPSHTMRGGGLVTSVGNSRVGKGVSVEVTIIGVGIGVDVFMGVGSRVGGSTD